MDHRRGNKTRLHVNAKRKNRRLVTLRSIRKRQLLSVAETDKSTYDCEPGPSSRVSSFSLCKNKSTDQSSDADSDEPMIQHASTEIPTEMTIASQSDDFPDFEVETEVVKSDADIAMHGRRIVDVAYLLQQLQHIEDHHPGCRLKNLSIVKEQRYGFQSDIHLYCSGCGSNDIKIQTTEGEGNDINFAAVAGIVKIGSAYKHLLEFTSALDIPAMSKSTFQRVFDNVCDIIEVESSKSMEEAAMEEKEIAISEGNIDVDGVPLVTVVCDGTWAKRSYKTKYNSLSGAAIIVGHKTKKVLWVSAKNRYCKICKVAENRGSPIPKHKCYKNHCGSAGSIEPTGIVEGFSKSEELYGIRYNHFIADGDSSVFKRLTAARPYEKTDITKIECRNHLLRNYCRKLRDLCKDTKAASSNLRKILQANILKLRSAVTKAIEFRKNEAGNKHTKIHNLKLDILNSPSHVFGEHKNCAELKYFCAQTQPDEDNFITDFKTTGFYDKIMKAVRFLSEHASSLIYDLDSNTVEQFNSLIAKLIAGKRINYTQRRSYIARCQYAALQRNSKRPYCRIFSSRFGTGPGKWATKFENTKKTLNKKRQNISYRSAVDKEKDYGPNCEKVAMSQEELEVAKNIYLQDLILTAEEREAIELRTREQSNSEEWQEIRKKYLTASHFGNVCRMLPHTSCRNIVANIVYPSKLKNISSIEYGKKFESLAVHQFSTTYNIIVNKCGLFVDEYMPYLAATPDGIIEPDGIVEVKCPYSARNLTPEQGISAKKILFWTKTIEENQEKYIINKKCKWYYQVQGQLHITNKNYCWFVVWTPYGMKCERVLKDNQFWRMNMAEKLQNFYVNCILPEILQPHKYKQNIKDPDYIILAKQEYTKKKEQLQIKKKIDEAQKDLIKIKQKSGDSDSDFDTEDDIPLTVLKS